eukprot:m.129096 g.129096  ORF g.129096 m.129096 type:complete len:214 (-) comp17453_c0_seq14:975-1616(-)
MWKYVFFAYPQDNCELLRQLQNCLSFEIIQIAVQECCEIFGPGNTVIFSNSAGSSDDPSFKEAIDLERSVGIPVLRHGTKKPMGFETISAHFATGTPEQLVMVGDRVCVHCKLPSLPFISAKKDSFSRSVCRVRTLLQIFTDVVFGNSNGMLTIKTEPLTTHGDNAAVRLVRELENIFVYVLGVAGVVAPPHILIENKTDAHKKTIMSYTKPR